MEIVSSSKSKSSSSGKGRGDQKEKGKDSLFHVVHKVPPGDGPYVRAKHAQLVQKDPETAIVWFWKAINAGDRVDSALKDMAVVMKQLDRTEEAIEAIRSFRGLCSKQAQESLDNVLIDLYKKCSKVDEQIELLRQKLRMIYQGDAFNGKPTKTARSHGKKFQVSIKQETSRVLGNLGWAYMQKQDYIAAEVVYRKAQMIDPDANKACNLGLSLIKQNRYQEASSILEDVLQGRVPGADDLKARARAEELMMDINKSQEQLPIALSDLGFNPELFEFGLDSYDKRQPVRLRPRRLPIFEEISSFKDQFNHSRYNVCKVACSLRTANSCNAWGSGAHLFADVTPASPPSSNVFRRLKTLATPARNLCCADQIWVYCSASTFAPTAASSAPDSTTAISSALEASRAMVCSPASLSGYVFWAPHEIAVQLLI